MDYILYPTQKLTDRISEKLDYPINGYDYLTKDKTVRSQVSLNALGGSISLIAAAISFHGLLTTEHSLGGKLLIGAITIFGVSIGVAQLHNAFSTIKAVSA